MVNRLENWIDTAVTRWVDAVTCVPKLVLALFAVLTAASFYGAAAHLRIDTDRADMLSADLPFRQHYEAYKRAFPQYVDTLLLVIDGHTPERARDAAEHTAARLRRDEALFATVWRPGAGPFFDRHGLLYLDVPALQDLADNLARVQPFLGTLTQDQSLRGLLTMTTQALEALEDGEAFDLTPLFKALDRALAANTKGRFYRHSWQKMMLGDGLSTDAQRQLIFVQPRLDYTTLLPAEPAIRALHNLADKFPPGVSLRVTGDVAMEYEEMQTVARGTGWGVLFSFALVTGVLLLCLRSPRLVIASMLTLGVSLLLTAGFATLAVGRLNLISIAFAILNIGLGADYAIHLCLRYRELKAKGAEDITALRTGVSHVGSSLVLAAATTAVGFYAFVPTAYAGVSELGLIAGTGLFIALFTGLSLLPALLTIWPSRTQTASHRAASGAFTEAVATYPLRYARSIRIGALFIAACAALALPFARFDYNPLNLRDQNTESVATFLDLVKNSDTPPWSITVLAPNPARAERLAARLNRLGSVETVSTLRDYVPQEQAEKLAVIDDLYLILGLELATAFAQSPPTYADQREALRQFEGALATYVAGDDANEKLPRAAKRVHAKVQRLLGSLDDVTPEAAAERIARLDRSLLASLPDTIDRLKTSLNAAPVELENLPPELTTHWKTPDGDYRVEVFPAEDLSNSNRLRDFVTQVRSVAPRATGLPVISLEAGTAIVTAFQQALVGSLVVIAVLLLLLMQSVKDALLVLVPLLLGSLLTAAVVVATGGRFNFANVIVLPLLLGIGVDNGIHLMHRLRSTGDSYADLLRTSTARGVFYSGLTTIVSFGILAFSAHPGTASMGRLLTIGVLMTLASSLIVLPALLDLNQRRSEVFR
jgi:hopanoid biosynthesis associated RND transporter like protein HpnN